MDNNYAEQAIRPFTIGRKNFVLIESSNGAKASAILYSLVETAKANMINTFEYFNLLLTEIPQHMEDKDLSFIDDLLPWSPRVQRKCLSRYKKSSCLKIYSHSKCVLHPFMSCLIFHKFPEYFDVFRLFLAKIHSTVTLLAKFLGLSTSKPFATET